jgi:HEAT repeat protein
MAFYDLPKDERAQLAGRIQDHLQHDLRHQTLARFHSYFGDPDTYIRKAGYLAIGRIYDANADLKQTIQDTLNLLLQHDHYHIRQTAINAAGEIGMKEFEPIEAMMNKGLFDSHHTVRNAVIGSVKKIGQKNPVPILQWARQYLNHPDKEIRREICHGIELRGRTHPQDILPMLKELQFDETARVRNTLVHVLGQIAYKKGCLQTVISDLQTWENQDLVKDALEEIIDVHDRYRDFAVLTQDEAKKYIANNFSRFSS